MGTARIAEFGRMRTLFRYWCSDHNGTVDATTHHNYSVGPGEDKDYEYIAEFNDGMKIGWKTVPGGKEYRIEHPSGDVETGKFRDMKFRLGAIKFTGADEREVRRPVVHPDNRQVRWDENQDEPEHGFTDDVVGEGYGEKYG